MKRYLKCEVWKDVSRDRVTLRFTNSNLGFIGKLGKRILKMLIFPNSGETDLSLVEEQKKSTDWIRLI